MNLTSPSQVKDWCIRNKFHPNRVLGQNFLIDKNALDAILDAADIEPGVSCLEVGPGLGVLTEGLLSRGCAVTAIEKDPVLAERLKGSLGDPQGLTVLAGDALDFIKQGVCDGFPLMVSNLPYQAGTRILIELVERVVPNAVDGSQSLVGSPQPSTLNSQLSTLNSQPTTLNAQRSTLNPPETMVVLVQTEVAERLAASEGSKVRGLAGVRVQFDYDVSIVRKVSASCFWPRPEIGSTVVKLVRHHRNDGVGNDVRRVFRILTKQAFEHRRKQLGSIFKGVIESTARAEELTNEDWLELSRNITL